MSWRDNLIEASYNGIYFHVSDSTHEFGRREVKHDYPFSEDPPYVEDLGRGEDTFRLSCYVIQDIYNNFDYFETRDNLIKAFNSSASSGTLTHPFYGILTVRPLGRVSFEEVFEQGGIARFTVTFLKVSAKKVTLPASAKDIGFVGKILAAARDIADSEFIENLGTKILTAPDLITDYSKGDVENFAQSSISAILSLRRFKSAALTKAIDNVKLLKSTAYLALTTPIKYAEYIRSIANEFATAIDIANLSQTYLGIQRIPETIGAGANNIMRAMQSWGKPITETVSANRYGGNLPEFPKRADFDAQRHRNRTNIIRLARYHLLMTQMEILMRTEFLSRDAALKEKEKVDSGVEDLLDYFEDTDEYLYTAQGDALIESQLAFDEYIATTADTLDPLKNKVLGPDGDNLLTATHDIYGNITNIIKIFELNRALTRHPGFFPPNANLIFIQ